MCCCVLLLFCLVVCVRWYWEVNLVADTLLIFNRVVASKKMTRSTMVGRVMNTTSLTVFFESVLHILSLFLGFRVQTLSNVVHATSGEDRTPRRTHRTCHRRTFFLCHAQMINAHVLGQSLTARVVYCALFLKKSFGHLMLHGTLLEPQFSSPSPFSTFLSTPSPTQTPNPMGIPPLMNIQRVQSPEPLRKEVSSLAAWPCRALSQKKCNVMWNIMFRQRRVRMRHDARG